MNVLMIIALVAIVVAGLAAILGVWIERDQERPKMFAWAISVVIVLATVLTVFQAYYERLESEKQAAADQADNEKLQNDLARMMQTLDKLAAESEDPQLLAFLSTELEAQARANPEVINKLAQRVEDEGGDPAKMLGKHISSSEVEKIARKGTLKTQPKSTAKSTADDGDKAPAKAGLPAHLRPREDKKPPAPKAAAEGDSPETKPAAANPRGGAAAEEAAEKIEEKIEEEVEDAKPTKMMGKIGGTAPTKGGLGKITKKAAKGDPR